MRSMEWKQLIGKTLHGSIVFDWWWKSYQSSAHKGLHVFGFCVVPREDSQKPSVERCMGTKIGMVQIISSLQKLWQNRRWANGIRVEYFTGFNTLQLNEEVKSLMFRLGETPEIFTRRIIFMSVFNDISCGSKDNETECLANAKLVSLYARRFGKGQWSLLVLVLRKVVLHQWRQSTRRMGQYGGKDVIGNRRKRMSNFPCHKSIV